ncbi:MAG TPA: DMT family transporter [Candidatus Dojkabacteria bacterium]|jgi:drug/metabolite transporter (DMT)-like permease
MLGIIFAQGSAILQATQNILIKKLVKKEDPFVVIWYTIFLSMLFLIPIVLINGIPTLGENFYLLLGIRIILDVFALSLYFYALKAGDVSLVIPLYSFSVVFSLISSSIINKEFPNWIGVIGIFIIIAGTYLLNLPIKERRKNILLPFKMLFNEMAARLILLSAFLYGIIYSINKAGIENSSTSFFTFSAALGLLVFFSCALLYKNKGDLSKSIQIRKFKQFLPLGLLDGVKIFLFMLAVTYTYVSFADASDNTTAIYSTIFAGLIFKEKIRQRIVPIMIMILGVVLITGSAYLSS